MKRYYFWEYTKSYGWRQMGRMDGYETMKELSENMAFYMVGKNASKDWKVLEATECLTKQEYDKS